MNLVETSRFTQQHAGEMMGQATPIRRRTRARQPMLPFGEINNRDETSSTFADNLSLPIHRWFRYSAGFSAQWVRQLIQREKSNGRLRVLDPFAGSGTTLLEAEVCGAESIGLESHPFVARIAKAKLYWREDADCFHSHATCVLDSARKHPAARTPTPALLRKCFPSETLARLDSLRAAIQAQDDGSPICSLVWLTLVAILRDCSPVGTAQWQYVLPRKTKANAMDPLEAYKAMATLIRDDMKWRQEQDIGPRATIHQDDARECASLSDGCADLVITSPPYANNYDYADATRLEMTFFGEIEGWGCLQDSVRKHLVRSCTQHVARISKDTRAIIETPLLDPIKKEIVDVCTKLGVEKEKHGGKKPYNTMIAAYFNDMANVWKALRRVAANDALVCFVVGDSAPYGVYVPVDRWLGELAVAGGFKSFGFEKTRDRNIKWKNRKHRVPLHEGRLWVKG
jgi:DNA modification methylase